jgi:hypothetical protein
MNDLSRREALGSMATLLLGLFTLRFLPGRSEKKAAEAPAQPTRLSVHPPNNSVRRHG